MPELTATRYLLQVDCVPAIAAWPLRIRALVDGVWEWVKRHAGCAVLLLDADGATFSVALHFHRAKTMRDTRRLLAGALADASWPRMGDGALDGDVTLENASIPAWESYINVLRAEPADLEPTFLRFRALAATMRDALLLEHFPPVMPAAAPPHALELLACGTDAEQRDAPFICYPEVPIDEPTRAAAMEAEDAADAPHAPHASDAPQSFTMPPPVVAADADPSYDRTIGMVQLLRRATLGAARDGCSYAIRKCFTEYTKYAREFSVHRVSEWTPSTIKSELKCAQVRVRTTNVMDEPDASGDESGMVPLCLNGATTRLHFLAADGEPTPVTVSIGAVFVDVLDGLLDAGAWLLTLSSVLPRAFIDRINDISGLDTVELSFGFTGMPEPFINLSRIAQVNVRSLDAMRPPVHVQQEHMNIIMVARSNGRFVAGLKYAC